MPSLLYTRTGVGWLSVAILGGCVWVASQLTGVAGIVAFAVTLLPLAYITTQLNRCYWSPWGRLHHRGTLAFAGLWGWETATAKKEGREPDPIRAHLLLMMALTNNSNPGDALLAMGPILSSKGAYLAQLLERHPDALRSSMPPSERSELLQLVKNQEMSEYIVIARAIELQYGDREAAAYAVAILSGKAR